MKRLLSAIALLLLVLTAGAFVVNVKNIPDQLKGAPLFITSDFDNRTLDSICIEGPEAQLSAPLNKKEMCSLKYSYEIEHGVRTNWIPLFLADDTAVVVFENYEKGEVRVCGDSMNTRFQAIYDSINSLRQLEPVVALLVTEFEANNSNPLGVFTLVLLAGNIDNGVWLEYYNDLPSELKAYPKLISKAKTIRAKLNTSTGSMYHDLEGIDTEGREVRLSDYVGKGKYILVDFWAYWCGPCRKEAKETLMPLYGKYKDNKDFLLLGIMTSDQAENHLSQFKNFNYPWPQLIDTKNEAGNLYGFEAIPFLILFAPDGTVLYRGIRGEQIWKCVEEVLGKAASQLQ